MRTPPVKWTSSKAKRALRASIYERDDFTCQACGWRFPSPPEDYDGGKHLYRHRWEEVRGDKVLMSDELQIDHIIPRCVGGPSDLENLQTLCGACNASKNGRTTWTGRKVARV